MSIALYFCLFFFQTPVNKVLWFQIFAVASSIPILYSAMLLPLLVSASNACDSRATRASSADLFR